MGTDKIKNWVQLYLPVVLTSLGVGRWWCGNGNAEPLATHVNDPTKKFRQA